MEELTQLLVSHEASATKPSVETLFTIATAASKGVAVIT
jgi:hypothetical protein